MHVPETSCHVQPQSSHVPCVKYLLQPSGSPVHAPPVTQLQPCWPVHPASDEKSEHGLAVPLQLGWQWMPAQHSRQSDSQQ
jgi:hypothetical protein